MLRKNLLLAAWCFLLLPASGLCLSLEEVPDYVQEHHLAYQVLLGDINQDGLVDESDRSLLEAFLLNPDEAQWTEENLWHCVAAADFNHDGSISDADLAQFDYLVGQYALSTEAAPGRTLTNAYTLPCNSGTSRLATLREGVPGSTVEVVFTDELLSGGRVRLHHISDAGTVDFSAVSLVADSSINGYRIGIADNIFTIQDEDDLEYRVLHFVAEFYDGSGTRLDSQVFDIIVYDTEQIVQLIEEVIIPPDYPPYNPPIDGPPPSDICPYIGHGCLGLILTFFRSDVNWDHSMERNYKRSMESLEKVFGSQGLNCEIIKHEVNVRPIPPHDAYLVYAPLGMIDTDNLGFSWWDAPLGGAGTQDQLVISLANHTDGSLLHELAMQGWINSLVLSYEQMMTMIDLYRYRLGQNTWESTFTVVQAHGCKAAPNEPATFHTPAQLLSCGQWSPNFGRFFSLPRAPFHQKNYQAAAGNVCNRLDIDRSCYAGLSVWANYELNNNSPALCMNTPSEVCEAHAGFDSDMALGTATASGVNGQSNTFGSGKWIHDTLESSAQGASSFLHFVNNLSTVPLATTQNPGLSTTSGILSKYQDGGYGTCNDPNGPGYGSGPTY